MLIKYTNNESIIQLYRPLIGTLDDDDDNNDNHRMNIISNTRSCLIHKKLVMTDGYTCKFNEGKITFKISTLNLEANGFLRNVSL